MAQIPLQPVLTFLLVFIRVLLFFTFLPVFGEGFTPVRARLLLAAAVGLVFAPLVAPARAVGFPQTLPQFVALTAPEALLGIAFGLVGRVVFAGVQFGGQIIGEQIGFGMAQIVDPTQRDQMPVVAQMLYIASLLVFFVTNSHHLFLTALARSFEQAPPGFLSASARLAPFFVEKTAWMFLIGVQMSLPIVAAVFAVNVAMGFVAKGVPQLNVFMESFPVRIMVGLFLLSVIMAFLVRMMTGMFAGLRDDLARILSFLGA